MDPTLKVLQIVSLALTAIAQFESIATRGTALITKARSEGRQPTDEELSALEAESTALETEVLASLRAAQQ